MKVLFVCSGNICRSPMAAEYFRHRALQSGLSHVVVASGGTLGIVGQPASAEAVEALGEIGVDLSAHRSSGLDDTVLTTSDVVLAMSRDHLEELAHRFPGREGRRFLLRAFEQGPEADSNAPDLPDPIGEPLEQYRQSLKSIVRSVDHLAIYLRHLRRTQPGSSPRATWSTRAA